MPITTPPVSVTPASVNVHEAKTHLSQLLARVEAGEEFLIARAGKPVARLVAARPPATPRRPLGLLRGRAVIPDDFDTWGQDETIAMFEGTDQAQP
ncbi:type II toxin-antitoxin system Phd/YefM family antitoxin [Promicromonospora sp. NPDC023805]|uniref:type II toxin-antitoxin system Phd/YefM family antitoxin n=1 Tax=Promicromonospora sp. NPDC023805 TaxID=3154696 RepID=UPI0033F7238B